MTPFVVWRRVAPLLREYVEEARDGRLRREKIARLTTRFNVLIKAMLNWASTLHPFYISFIPRLIQFRSNRDQFGEIIAFIEEDAEVKEETQSRVNAMVKAAEPDIIRWLQAKAGAMRSIIPSSWPSHVPATPSSPWPRPTSNELQQIFVKALSGLDLAVYVFTCPAPHQSHPRGESPRPFFGLDSVAYQCTAGKAKGLPKDYELVPSRRGHAVVMQLLKLLGKDSATTTARDMDAMQWLVACTECKGPSTSTMQLQKAFTWRAAVRFLDL